jgi:hypothetical protein
MSCIIQLVLLLARFMQHLGKMRAMKTVLFSLVLISSLTVCHSQSKKDIYANLSLYKDVQFPDLYLSSADIGTSFYLNEGKCAIGPEVSVYRFFSPSYSSLGLGIRPFIRTYIVKDPSFSFFIDCKGGLLFMVPEYKHQRYNYTFVGGLGSDIRISPKSAVRASLAYHHFSNRKSYEYAHNTNSDGIGGQIGYVYRFK